MAGPETRRESAAKTPYRIVFVCSGNICRSPTAEVVMRSLIDQAGLGELIDVRSAGMGDWHVGEQADPRTLTAMRNRGYDGSAHRARQFEREWFDHFDSVIALDTGHLRALQRIAPERQRDKVRLLLSFDPQAGSSDVPDPYYGGKQGFDDVLAMIERACRAMFDELRRDLAA